MVGRNRIGVGAVLIAASLVASTHAYAADVPDPGTSAATLRLSIDGERIRERCSDVYEVITQRRFGIVARTSDSGIVHLRLERRNADGTWASFKTPVASVIDGRAVSWMRLDAGRYRVQGRFISRTGTVARSASLAIRVLTPKWRRYSDGGARLTVRYYRQQHRLSCEAATLRMAHNFHNPSRIDDDMAVYRITGHEKDRRPARNGGCNPDRAFCGRVDGTMMRDGYGVHSTPIARAATYFDTCRPSLHLRGSSYSYAAIARAVNDGYPVVAWGAHRGASGTYRYRWRAWDGHPVTAWSVEHTVTVVGFHGSPSYPTSFLVHDPSRTSGSGYQRWSRAKFAAFATYFKTAVVVRG